MEKFEEKLAKLEQLSADIKQSNISLEDALKDFEEGIKLAKSLEKDLDSMENKIQILMNNPDVSEEAEKKAKKATKNELIENGPELSLFDSTIEVHGTRA